MFLLFPLHLQADFDDLGVNARAISMGGALTALADDAQCAPLNPAGLGYLRRAEIGSDYGRLWMGLEDDSTMSIGSLAFAMPLTRQKRIVKTIDISTGAAPGEMLKEKRTITVLSRYGSAGIFYRKFSLSGAYEESTLGLSWGRVFGKKKKWSYGLSLKQLGEKYTQDSYTQIDPVFANGGSGSVSATSFDTGLIYNVIPRVFIGASLLDMNQPNVGLAESEALPRTEKLGLGYRHGTLEAGFDYTKRDSEYTMGTGFEKYMRDRKVAFRGGFVFGSGNLSRVTGGFGFNMNQARLDYSLEYPLNGVQEIMGNHRVSIVFKFGEPIPDEAEPGSLEQAYIQTRDRLVEIEAKLAEVEENRDTLEKVLVEESTQRIQERIESARALARSRAQVKQDVDRPKKEVEKVEVKIRTHRIEKGDTLQSLAEKYFNDRSLWRAIYEENKELVGRGGSLKTGLLLVIPPLESINRGGVSGSQNDAAPGEKRSKWSKPDAAAQPEAPLRTHVVKDGETLQALAQKYYGNSNEWQKIYSRNKDKIIRGVPAPGAELVIP